jgi:dynein assembly factor 1
VICRLRGLTYLDDRPVFEDERRLALAWQAGGREGEKAEREAIRLEKEAKDEANRQAFQDMIDASRARRAAEDPESVFISLSLFARLVSAHSLLQIRC